MGSKSASIGAVEPKVSLPTPESFNQTIENTDPDTQNPSPEDLIYNVAESLDAELVAQSLNHAEDDLRTTSKQLSLKEVLLFSTENAREMTFAEYDYLSVTLSLLNELHLWGPRFSNTISSNIDGNSDDGLYETALDVVNDFQVTQNLYNGGAVSANALSSFARGIHNSTENSSSSTDLAVALEIPLLQGSGAVARESLIQAKRNLVYAARTFERFRRVFYKAIGQDYLSLVVQKQSLANAQMGVDSLKQLAKRQAALYSSGRARLYDSADAENQALAAVARLSQSWEQYRLAVDRFKIRIGWPIDSVVDIVPTSLDIGPPKVDVSQAVLLALQYRLDLQNKYNGLEDTERGVVNAINDLLPNAVFNASVNTSSDFDKPAKFTGQDIDYLVGLSISLPIDKETERISVRQEQILLERAKRTYREAMDSIAVEVRSALRKIEVYQFTLDLQNRNVEIAQLGLDSINADPDRVSVLDQTRAISDLQGAQDARDSARRDLELSIIDYLLQAGQLRISQNGELVLPKNSGKLK